jgi:hypothetical protein
MLPTYSRKWRLFDTSVAVPRMDHAHGICDQLSLTECFTTLSLDQLYLVICDLVTPIL